MMRVFQLLAALSASAAGPAAAFGVRVVGNLDAALDPVRAEDVRAEACAALGRSWPPPAGRVWLRAETGGLAAMADAGATAEAAAFWADLALGAEALASTLLGAEVAVPPDIALMVEAGPEGVVLFDGQATRHVADACAALDGMAAALGEAGGLGVGAAAGEAAEAAAPPPVALQAGSAAEIVIAGVPTSTAEEGAMLVVKGPDGVAGEASFDGGGAARGWVAAAADARPGRGRLHVYRPEDPFRPIGEAEVVVAPGAGAGAPSGVLTAGLVVESEAPLGGEVALPVSVPEGGRLSLRSIGPLDLAARLERADGAPVAADDDGGEGYGFAVEVELEPGDYVLRVRHCCGGGGRFAVAAESR